MLALLHRLAFALFVNGNAYENLIDKYLLRTADSGTSLGGIINIKEDLDV